MELAESHMRFVEVGQADGRRIRDLEMDLRMTQIANSKLAEDKEYYQILLQERTMNGELAHRGVYHAATDSYTTAADDVVQEGTANIKQDPETVRKLESQVLSLQDQNNALTLYINRIITRLLQHESFEALFENGSVTGENPLNAMSTISKNMSQLQLATEHEDIGKENVAPSILKRAGSILGSKTVPLPRTGATLEHAPPLVTPPPPNPDHVIKAPVDAITARPIPHPNEDPNTAIRIPLRRAESRRRTYRMPSGELSSNNPYRGPSSIGSRQSSGQTSPGNSYHRTSYFGNGPPALASFHDAVETQLRDSMANSDSGYSESTSAQANPRSISPSRSTSMSSVITDGKASSTGTTAPAGPPNTPGRIRTLRLVQEKVEADEAAAAEKKKANRNSWMGWFGKGEMPPPPPPTHRTQQHWPVPRGGGSPVKGRTGSGAW